MFVVVVAAWLLIGGLVALVFIESDIGRDHPNVELLAAISLVFVWPLLILVWLLVNWRHLLSRVAWPLWVMAGYFHDRRGGCPAGYACNWVWPFGWVHKAGCPAHDK